MEEKEYKESNGQETKWPTPDMGFCNYREIRWNSRIGKHFPPDAKPINKKVHRVSLEEHCPCLLEQVFPQEARASFPYSRPEKLTSSHAV